MKAIKYFAYAVGFCLVGGMAGLYAKSEYDRKCVPDFCPAHAQEDGGTCTCTIDLAQRDIQYSKCVTVLEFECPTAPEFTWICQGECVGTEQACSLPPNEGCAQPRQ